MSYQIKITPNYYTNTINAPQARLLTRSDLGDNDLCTGIAEWDTEDETQAVIDDLESGNYYLRHGEAGRPDYEIIEDYDIGEHCKPVHSYCDIESGKLPEKIKEELDQSNVEYEGQYDAEYDHYSYYIDADDKRYGIHFVVSTIAIQLYFDDLSNINWEHATYTCVNID